MTFLAFTGLLNFIFSASLAIVVYRQCPRRDLGRAYGHVNLAIGTFSAFYFLWQCVSTPIWGLFYLRMLVVSAIWINQMLIQFNSVYLGADRLRTRIIYVSAVVNVLFSILHFTGLLYNSVIPRYGFGFWPPHVTGWFVAFLICWHAELFYAIGDLLYSRHRATGHRRAQITYIVLAFIIGYFGGITNWPMWFGIRIPPYLNILVSGYCLIVAYAVVKHQLMDVTIVIRKTLQYSLVSAALASIYVGTITLLAYVLQGRVGPASPYSSALAAVLITLLFNPIRRRAQHIMDRYFLRESLDQVLLREATSGFVHEIKRPLANISLPAELSLSDIEDLRAGRRTLDDVLPKIEQRLRFILGQSMDAGTKMEAIREVAMAERKTFADVDLRTVVMRGLEMERNLFDRLLITAAVECPEDLPMLKGDARQLEIVISNLLKNAAEAMADLPLDALRHVVIHMSVETQGMTLKIKDNGRGIKPETLPRLFEPYFSTKGAQGMGMGLFLCRLIIQQHGGSITARSEVAKGSSFLVRLPRTA